MNKKYVALALAGVLSLGLLAACVAGGGTGEPDPTPPVTASPAPSEVPAPTDTPAPTAEPTEAPQESPDPTLRPDPTAKPTEKPAATAKPTEKPAATAKPTQKPTPAPTQPPAATPTPAPETNVVQSVWDEIAKGELPALMDVDAATLKDLYGISSSDVEEFICKMPMMSANINEYFIAKVADGKMDAVKAACEKRQQTLAGGFLYPSQTELVNNYKLVTSGNYILFCITDGTDAAVNAFNTYTK